MSVANQLMTAMTKATVLHRHEHEEVGNREQEPEEDREPRALEIVGDDEADRMRGRRLLHAASLSPFLRLVDRRLLRFDQLLPANRAREQQQGDEARRRPSTTVVATYMPTLKLTSDARPTVVSRKA